MKVLKAIENVLISQQFEHTKQIATKDMLKYIEETNNKDNRKTCRHFVLHMVDSGLPASAIKCQVVKQAGLSSHQRWSV